MASRASEASDLSKDTERPWKSAERWRTVGQIGLHDRPI